MKLNVIEIVKNLPKPNCRECGEPTCMVFAAKLIKKEKRLEECKPLLATEHAEKWMRLKGILASA